MNLLFLYAIIGLCVVGVLFVQRKKAIELLKKWREPQYRGMNFVEFLSISSLDEMAVKKNETKRAPLEEQPIASNSEHPSYPFHQSIDRKLKRVRGDLSVLSSKELDFYLSYGLDSYSQGDSIVSFLREFHDPKNWQRTPQALKSVGAFGYEAVMRRFLAVDAEGYAQAVRESVEDDFMFSENWDDQLLQVRREGNPDDPMLYMERLLDDFVRGIEAV